MKCETVDWRHMTQNMVAFCGHSNKLWFHKSRDLLTSQILPLKETFYTIQKWISNITYKDNRMLINKLRNYDSFM
jgi:hypothetical protein